MGILSNVVSGVLGDTSDIAGNSIPLPNFSAGTASIAKDIDEENIAPVNYGDVKDTGSGEGGGGIMGMAMSMLSDINGKKNIAPASKELDRILNQVYAKMKEKR